MNAARRLAAIDAAPPPPPRDPRFALRASEILALCQDAINLYREYVAVHAVDEVTAVAKALGEVREALDLLPFEHELKAALRQDFEEPATWPSVAMEEWPL